MEAIFSTMHKVEPTYTTDAVWSSSSCLSLAKITAVSLSRTDAHCTNPRQGKLVFLLVPSRTNKSFHNNSEQISQQVRIAAGLISFYTCRPTQGQLLCLCRNYHFQHALLNSLVAILLWFAYLFAVHEHCSVHRLPEGRFALAYTTYYNTFLFLQLSIRYHSWIQGKCQGMNMTPPRQNPLTRSAHSNYKAGPNP